MTARARILSAVAKFAARPIEVPALGGTLYVRPLTVGGMARTHAVGVGPSQAHQRAQEAARAAPDDLALAAAERQAAEALQAASERIGTLMIIDCVVDENGAPVFTMADEALVAGLPFSVAEALLAAVDAANKSAVQAGGEALGN